MHHKNDPMNLKHNFRFRSVGQRSILGKTPHILDVLSLSAMALICVARNGQRETTVPRAPIQIPSQTGIQKAVSSLLKSTMEKVAKAQEADGSFGNEFSTSLAVQVKPILNLLFRY